MKKWKKSTTVYLREDWFKDVQAANWSKRFIVTEMRQEDVSDCKSYILARYKPPSKDTEGHRVKLRDIHWLNFGWGEDTDLRTVRRKLFYHPNLVWVCYGFLKNEQWKKIKLVPNTRLSSGTGAHQLFTVHSRASAHLKFILLQ